MLRRVLLFPLLFTALLTFARDKQGNWIQISTQHFTVVCEGNEKQARRIADQFERMRMVFHTAFPNMRVDPSAPIVVVAVKDYKSFRTLEPEAYLAKGQLELAGFFLRAPDKNYILLRLDAGGEHPYATIYHEYTHLMLSKVEWMPLWLNEGMAEFYQNTDISEKGTVLGQPSPDDILWLRHNRLLPLPTLFGVDHNSPYYHEEQKGSIFYAESWALTHYLEVRDAQTQTNKIRDYLVLVGDQVDPVTAATRTFGDLKQLQSALDSYIAQSSFRAFRLTKELPLDGATYKIQPITPTQVDAVRADFLAYVQRENDSRSLLDAVLHDAPNNTLAHETMGYLEFRAGHLEPAQHWFAEAVKLDSQSYLANYYFAAITLNLGQFGEDIDTQIEASLQKAIKLNPSFAPSFDEMATFYAMRHKDLDKAHMLALQAIQLDPGNVRFRMTVANILVNMQRESDAVSVLRNALKIAKTQQETIMVQNQLDAIQNYQLARERNEEQARQFEKERSESASDDPGADAKPHDQALTGPRRTVIGTFKNVHCSYPAVLDADVEAAGKTISLHARNFYKINFSALNYTPKAEFLPCSDLEGMHGKAEYIESSSAKTNGLVSIELEK